MVELYILVSSIDSELFTQNSSATTGGLRNQRNTAEFPKVITQAILRRKKQCVAGINSRSLN